MGWMVLGIVLGVMFLSLFYLLCSENVQHMEGERPFPINRGRFLTHWIEDPKEEVELLWW